MPSRGQSGTEVGRERGGNQQEFKKGDGYEPGRRRLAPQAGGELEEMPQWGHKPHQHCVFQRRGQHATSIGLNEWLRFAGPLLPRFSSAVPMTVDTDSIEMSIVLFLCPNVIQRDQEAGQTESKGHRGAPSLGL